MTNVRKIKVYDSRFLHKILFTEKAKLTLLYKIL